LRHQVGQDRLLERHGQRSGRSLHGHQDDQRRRALVSRGDDDGEHDGGRRGSEIAGREDRPARQPVGQGAADW
jgi:hypothetical protein